MGTSETFFQRLLSEYKPQFDTSMIASFLRSHFIAQLISLLDQKPTHPKA